MANVNLTVLYKEHDEHFHPQAHSINKLNKIQPSIPIASTSRYFLICESCGGKTHTTEKCRFRNYRCHKYKQKGLLARLCKNINLIDYSEHDEVQVNLIRHAKKLPKDDVCDMFSVYKSNNGAYYRKYLFK